MSKIKLKPCPFCGAEAVMTPTRYKHWVVCSNCWAQTFGDPTKEAAAERWNKRADEAETKKCKDCKYFTYRVRYGYEETYGCEHPLLEYATECDDYWLNMTEDCFCSMWEAKNEHTD